MKRLIVIALILNLLLPNANAESFETKRDRIIASADQVQTWIDFLTQKSRAITDENSLLVLQDAIDELTVMKGGIISSLANAESNLTPPSSESILNGFAVGMEETEHCVYTTIKTDIFQGNTEQYYVCEIEYSDNYQKIILHSFDASFSPLFTQKIEIAVKDEELLVLLVDYDATENIIAKVAVLVNEDTASTIISQVFGTEMNLVLQPREWQEGKLIITEWNKRLLLPLNK